MGYHSTKTDEINHLAKIPCLKTSDSARNLRDFNTTPYTKPRTMIRSYMTLALRSIRKNKLVSLINIGGFSAALAFGMLAVVFAHNELTYDLFHVNADRIYRICMQSGDRLISRTPWPLGPAFASEFPDVSVVRVYTGLRSISYGRKSFRVGGSYVDKSFLDVFSFPLAKGHASTALRDVRSIVITEKVARKLFPGANPVGKVVTVNRKKTYTVTGVLSRLPENSSIVFDYLLPADAADESLNSWKFPSANTFVLLPQYLEPRKIKDRLSRVVQRGWGRGANAMISLLLQPFNEVHLDQRTRGVERSSNAVYMYIFFGIALIVITISSVNFSALAIGRSLLRAKEAGVRRLFGARRRHVATQYVVESVLLALMALVAGLGLMGAILPSFNSVVGTKISMFGQLSVTTLLYVLLLTVAIGILAGLYPALALSRPQPADVLFARPESVKPGFLMRLLLVIQFSMSMVLMMCALAMAAQLNLLTNKNPGFRTDGVIAVETGRLLEASPGLVDVFEKNITSYPGIIGVARGQHPLSNKLRLEGFARADGRTVHGVETIAVDYDLLKTLKFDLVEGRYFNRSISSDRNVVIINQALMKQFGWRSAKNKTVDLNGNGDAPIIGVIEDFHFKSFHRQVAPAIILLRPEYCNLSFVLSTFHEDRDILDILQKEWHKVAPSKPFRAGFLEDDLKNQYKGDKKWLNAIQLPAILALGLACLGAFGLTSFSVGRRTKEIGIRKVFGTPIHRLMARLSIDFIKIVILSTIVAGSIAYLVLGAWLENFVYRIDLIAPIVAGGVLTFAFVMLAVSFKTYKAATLNTANTLRDE